jgi:hypothetical protein
MLESSDVTVDPLKRQVVVGSVWFTVSPRSRFHWLDQSMVVHYLISTLRQLVKI